MIRGRTLKPEDVLLITRRWIQIVVPFLIISLATFLYVRRLPDRYQAETLILVVPQRVPDSYVRTTVSTKISDRLNSINQQIMSRSRLEPVIREFNLYPGLVKTGMMEDVVARMRSDVVAQVVRGDAFRISYIAGEPRTAMKVTERLASMYIDENLRDREVLADGTNQFLESQLATAKDRLIEHEKKLEDYNRRYAGQLPTQVGSNLQVLQNAQLQIQALLDSISRDKDRQMVLEGLLADANAGSASEAAAASGTASGPPPPAVMRSAAQLDAANKTLQEMQLRLKPEHPDVIHQKRTIAELQKKVNEEAAIVGLQPRTQAPVVTDRVEMARLNRITQARAELDALGPQIAKKEREEARLRGVVAEYQSRVEAAPTRESELIELTRDYSTLQGTYQSLLRKKEDAQLSANLERYQIGEQFKILDPARMPEKPISPDRPRLYALGGVMGLAVGIAFAVFLEFRDTTLKTETDVVMAVGLPVLALIPELVTDVEKAVRRRRKLLASFAAAGAAATVAGVLLWVFRGPGGLW